MHSQIKKLLLAASLVLVVCVGFADTALATSSVTVIRGLIDTSSKGLGLRVRDSGSLYQIDSKNILIQGTLLRLRHGDYLVARGSIDELTQSIDIEAIESLGLKELIGAWASSRLEVYEFQDFTKLNLYVPNADRNAIVQAGQFNYAVAPDKGTRYTIFLSDNNSVIVGSIELKKQRLKLQMIDPKTGRVSENISLSPLSVK